MLCNKIKERRTIVALDNKTSFSNKSVLEECRYISGAKFGEFRVEPALKIGYKRRRDIIGEPSNQGVQRQILNTNAIIGPNHILEYLKLILIVNIRRI